MSRKISGRFLLLSLLMMCFCVNAHSQALGANTPYSIFGLGDLSNPGSAYHKTMGGVGIANRDVHFMNLINPAAVTARDSLSFMVDVSLYGDNKIFRQGEMKSASNTFNINDLAMSFPLWKSSAMMLGIMPFSDTGFGYVSSYKDPYLIGNTGDISFVGTGKGSVYKAFASAGVTFWKRLSIGAQADYYFGKLEKNYTTSFSDASYNGVSGSSIINISGISGKFGLQYEQPLTSNLILGIGATYSTGAKLKGTVENSKFSAGSAVADTLYYKMDTLGIGVNARIPSEIGVGVTLKYANKWLVEFDYTRSDWTSSGLAGVSGMSVLGSDFKTTVSDSYRVGFEIVPNRNDIRYYMKQVSYRAGAYYRNEYYLYNGQRVSSKGITFGATFPVFRWYNGITVGVDLGERGALGGQMIRERYVNVSVGVNIFDIWFRKQLYQ